ncbi:type I-F CRISPR-associated protein Csy2 [Halomonas cerina]|uniref:CRISPR-associated protein Csy2 n=1 Tax=Halomonas cerina TaxID=447424 RepID=A0A839V710_9GAMM|nr:type I-F CRISPR-associated protein Csy2 [Halomonas cerina]MBB3190931.1 CRISPR-associated protein Csy2 [Halomonas cerina]
MPMPDPRGLLILPRLKVQNANAVSSPMTWGFPSMTAFTGFAQALERRLGDRLELLIDGVGVICHHHEAQVTRDGEFSFHQPRLPTASRGAGVLDSHGVLKTASFIEEGRMHLEVTVVLGITDGTALQYPDDPEAHAIIREAVVGLRLAGGSFLADTPIHPELVSLGDDEDQRRETFRRLTRRWLPGFALVLRHDLLAERLVEMRETRPETTLMDAWLDMAAMHWDCHQADPEGDAEGQASGVEWSIRRPPGWIVPIPVGYGAISKLHEPGEVANARDNKRWLAFTETLYSLGEWKSPHRLTSPQALLWYIDNDLEQGIYRLNNDYVPSDSTQPTD